MKTVNAIIRKVSRFGYKIILVRENGTRYELPSAMSLHAAVEVQKLFRKH